MDDTGQRKLLVWGYLAYCLLTSFSQTLPVIGFFSIQVLENALQVWGLTFVAQLCFVNTV